MHLSITLTPQKLPTCAVETCRTNGNERSLSCEIAKGISPSNTSLSPAMIVSFPFGFYLFGLTYFSITSAWSCLRECASFGTFENPVTAP